MSAAASFEDHKVRKYLEQGLILFFGDLPENEYQRGFRDALALAYAQGLMVETEDSRINAMLAQAGALRPTPDTKGQPNE